MNIEPLNAPDALRVVGSVWQAPHAAGAPVGDKAAYQPHAQHVKVAVWEIEVSNNHLFVSSIVVTCLTRTAPRWDAMHPQSGAGHSSARAGLFLMYVDVTAHRGTLPTA
jgi:hypothetical protein